MGLNEKWEPHEPPAVHSNNSGRPTIGARRRGGGGLCDGAEGVLGQQDAVGQEQQEQEVEEAEAG